MKTIILALFALVGFAACTNDSDDSMTRVSKEKLDGKVAVELKDTTLFFEIEAGTKMVSMGGDKGWWVDEISTDGNSIAPTAEEKEFMADGGGYEAECEWVSVKRSGANLEVSVRGNDYEPRRFEITLASDNTVATISGGQVGLDGMWEDNIHLTPDNMTFTAEGGTQFCTTNKENLSWAIVTVTVGDEIYPTSLSDRTLCYDEHLFEKTFEWVGVRRDEEKLYVTAGPNITGEERAFKIQLVSGDYSVVLHGRQLAE